MGKSSQTRQMMIWILIGLFFLAGILTIGVSWSHIWRRITGQVSVEHLDN